jgi:hypothetical protein
VFIIGLYEQTMIWSSLKGDEVLPHSPPRIDTSTKLIFLIATKMMCPNEILLKHLEAIKMIWSFLFLSGLVGKCEKVSSYLSKILDN